MLIAHNLKDGLDLYQLSHREHLHRFKYRSDSEEYIVSTAFLHGGTAVIGGSSSGEVLIWEINSGEIFQVLGYGCTFGRYVFVSTYLILEFYSASPTQVITVITLARFNLRILS